MKNKFILILIGLSCLSALAQNPYVLPQGRANQVTEVKGGSKFNKVLVMPTGTHEQIYHQLDSLGRIQINADTKKLEYHNGVEWIEPGSGAIGSDNAQQVFNRGSEVNVTDAIRLFSSTSVNIAGNYGAFVNIGSNSGQNFSGLTSTPTEVKTSVYDGQGEAGIIAGSMSVGIAVRDQISQSGLFYEGDYTANQIYNDRAIPDVGAVKQLIANQGGGSETPSLQEVMNAGSSAELATGNYINMASYMPDYSFGISVAHSPSTYQLSYLTGIPGEYNSDFLVGEGSFQFTIGSPRLNIYKDYTTFSVLPANYDNEIGLRSQMNNDSYIPSIGKTKELIEQYKTSPQNLQQTVDIGSEGIIPFANENLLKIGHERADGSLNGLAADDTNAYIEGEIVKITANSVTLNNVSLTPKDLLNNDATFVIGSENLLSYRMNFTHSGAGSVWKCAAINEFASFDITITNTGSANVELESASSGSDFYLGNPMSAISIFPNTGLVLHNNGQYWIAYRVYFQS